jgi:hypothetical protein
LWARMSAIDCGAAAVSAATTGARSAIVTATSFQTSLKTFSRLPVA